MTGDIDRVRRNWCRAMQSGRAHIMVDLETAAELLEAARILRDMQGRNVVPFRARQPERQTHER